MTYESSDVTAGTDAQADEYNNLRQDLVTGRKTVVVASDEATVTFDLDEGNIQEVTLAGNRTLALLNDNVGQAFMLIIKQDGTGSRVPTWFSNIKWAGGAAPVLSTGANDIDAFIFIKTGASEFLGSVTGIDFATP